MWYVFDANDPAEPIAGPFFDHEAAVERADALEAEHVDTEVSMINNPGPIFRDVETNGLVMFQPDEVAP